MASPRLLRMMRPKGRSEKSRQYASREGFSGTSEGVSARPAPGVSEVTIVHRNGKNIARAPATTITCSTTGPSTGPRRRVAVSAIGHPPPLPEDLHDGHAEHDREEQPAEGGRLARRSVAEGQVVDLLHDHLGGASRATARHRVHLVEHLEAVDERDDHDEEGARA